MKQHRRKITVRVTDQTAYHLERMAEQNNAQPGEIIDRMMISVLQAGNGRGFTGNNKKQAKKVREGGQRA